MAKDISAPNCFRKDGIFYFERRIPSDLLDHYKSAKIAYSLRTRCSRTATARARRASDRLDEYWYHLRLTHQDVPGKHLLRDRAVEPQAKALSVSPAGEHASESVLLSDAVRIYLKLKGKGRPETFHRAAERSCGYLIDVCGDKEITSYSRSDATRFRDSLVQRELAGSSMTRIIGNVRAVINLAASELGITIANPFKGLFFDKKAGVQRRVPFPDEQIREIQSACRRQDDELRWLVALLSDTGMRLAEAVGLVVEDFRLEAEIPHVVVVEKPWRRLKNTGSNREIPLVGASLWAARRICESRDADDFAFPAYNKGEQSNANSASATLNKWMRPRVPERCTVHSFRHSMRDRLRAVECPSDVVDQIGGWQSGGVGHSYGSGYPLSVLHKWLKAVE